MEGADTLLTICPCLERIDRFLTVAEGISEVELTIMAVILMVFTEQVSAQLVLILLYKHLRLFIQLMLEKSRVTTFECLLRLPLPNFLRVTDSRL